jgi:very-short-patch-repair endonuclease
VDVQSAAHHIDRAVARLADGQYGVVARRQLLGVGLGRGAIEARVRRGLLIPLHRGVYALGHRRLTRDGIWLAAVLAAGPDAVLSHRDAATLHGLGRWSYGAVEVSSPRRGVSTSRVRVHERRLLDAADVTAVAGIPVTTVARMLVDLADLLGHQRLLRAVTEAERVQKLDVAAVEAALDRVHGRRGPGRARMRAALEELARHGVQLTREELELALRALIREHELPPARHNAWIDGREVDAFWPHASVVVEADGWEFHRGRAAFARDRAKTNQLTLAGYVVLRFTHDDVVRRPAHVAAAIRRALAATQAT